MKKTTNDIGIRCPKCRGKLRVIRTTPTQGNYVSRRLECVGCGERTNSVERLVHDAPPNLPAISDGLLRVSIGQLEQTVKQLAELTGVSEVSRNNPT